MKGGRITCVTEQQAAIHTLFVKHRSISQVARILGIRQIRVREALVQYQRNRMRDAGIVPPPLREMMRGNVGTRFGVARTEFGGRPAKHSQSDPMVSGSVGEIRAAEPVGGPREIRRLDDGVRRIIVTSVERGAEVHRGFWDSLRAYASHLGAEILVMPLGDAGHGRVDLTIERDVRQHLQSARVDVGGVVDIAADARPPLRASRPLDQTQLRRHATWTIVGHPVIQLETLTRLRADGLRIQLTSGAISLPKPGSPGATRDEVGAVIVELAADGHAHCRHLLARIEGPGDFQDLGTRVRGTVVDRSARVEALSYGDVHHVALDPIVAAATWGLGAEPRPGGGGRPCLLDELRPATQIFQDVCDFGARSPFDARDHHKRFAQFVRGGGDVRGELADAAAFLAATRRPWASSVVVQSNHDDMLVQWLRDAGYRDDPENAVFFLETSLYLHRRLQEGVSVDGFFGQTLRRLAGDRLRHVRFLQRDEILRIVGIENGVHGHRGADGRRGDIRVLERMGIRATIGHTHRPTVRDGIYSVGVCQTELEYAHGHLTSWAVGHVVTYATGARQHLILNGGRFHA